MYEGWDGNYVLSLPRAGPGIPDASRWKLTSSCPVFEDPQEVTLTFKGKGVARDGQLEIRGEKESVQVVVDGNTVTLLRKGAAWVGTLSDDGTRIAGRVFLGDEQQACTFGATRLP